MDFFAKRGRYLLLLAKKVACVVPFPAEKGRLFKSATS